MNEKDKTLIEALEKIKAYCFTHNYAAPVHMSQIYFMVHMAQIEYERSKDGTK